MSREIKFRGRNPNNGQWKYGDLIQYESGEVAILNRFSKHGFEATEICYRTIASPETVGQYTGLKDKHGVEIWEGDIIRIEYPGGGDFENTVGRVWWDEDEGAFYHGNDQGRPPKRLWFRWTREGRKSNVTVIGNVHDNPELLEVTD